MLKTLSKSLMTVAVIAMLTAAVVVPVLAVEDPGVIGSGPQNPLVPTEGWVSLNNGESRWYAFRDEGDLEDIAVRMAVSPSNSALFEVLTPDQVRDWANGVDFDPVGISTVNEHLSDDLYWTGNFVKSGTYYVRVYSRNVGPSNYSLSINGDDVSFPQIASEKVTPESAADVLAEQKITIDTDTTEAAAMIVAGTSSETAAAPMGEPVQIQGGEKHWYAFRDEGDGASINIQLDAAIDGRLGFEVWTPEQLRLWANGIDFEPTGAGTENEFVNTDLFWSGSFVKGDTYYVIVEQIHPADSAVTYTLSVNGEDVSY